MKDASHALFEEMGGQEGKMKGRKDIPPTNYFPQDQSQLKMIKFRENMERKCEMCDITMSKNMEVMTHVQKKQMHSRKHFQKK